MDAEDCTGRAAAADDRIIVAMTPHQAGDLARLIASSPEPEP
jgi:hypothetical protein